MFSCRKKHKYNVYIRGAEVLTRRATPIDKITPEISAFATELIESMRLFDGVGLAAPQAGVSKRIVALGVPNKDLATPGVAPGNTLLLPLMPMVIINPEIISFSNEVDVCDEGCLSVPEIYAPVQRSLAIAMRAQLLSGEHIECHCNGLLARCIQHELDHLNGILFVDRLVPEELDKIASKLRVLEKYGRKVDFKKTISV